VVNKDEYIVSHRERRL